MPTTDQLNNILETALNKITEFKTVFILFCGAAGALIIQVLAWTKFDTESNLFLLAAFLLSSMIGHAVLWLSKATSKFINGQITKADKKKRQEQKNIERLNKFLESMAAYGEHSDQYYLILQLVCLGPSNLPINTLTLGLSSNGFIEQVTTGSRNAVFKIPEELNQAATILVTKTTEIKLIEERKVYGTDLDELISVFEKENSRKLSKNEQYIAQKSSFFQIETCKVHVTKLLMTPSLYIYLESKKEAEYNESIPFR